MVDRLDRTQKKKVCRFHVEGYPETSTGSVTATLQMTGSLVERTGITHKSRP